MHGSEIATAEELNALTNESARALNGDEPTSGEDVGGPCSFTPATRVATEHGKVNIGKLHVGEKVWAYNPRTHTMELQPILHVWINHDNDLVDLTITTTMRFSHLGTESTQTSEVIHTNRKHPFFTLEDGFVSVSKISLGMHILRADGSFGVVTGWKMVPGTQEMYNLEVAHDHTFTVGDGQWVVHNACVPSFPEDASQLSHIFKDEPGHILDTSENRILLINTASDESNYMGMDKWGNNWYSKDLPDGRQVWVSVRNGQIRNGGINDSPRPWYPNTGYSNPNGPNSP